MRLEWPIAWHLRVRVLATVLLPGAAVCVAAAGYWHAELGAIGRDLRATRTIVARTLTGAPLQAEAQRIADAIERDLHAAAATLERWRTDSALAGALGADGDERERSGVAQATIAHIEAHYGTATTSDGLASAPAARRLATLAAHTPSTGASHHWATDRHGFASSPPPGGDDAVQSDEPWWQQAWRDGRHTSAVTHATGAAPALAMSARVELAGRGVGIVRTDLRLDWLAERARRATTAHPGREAVITDEHGRVIATTNEKAAARAGNALAPEADGALRAAFTGGETGIARGSQWTSGYASIAMTANAIGETRRWRIIVLEASTRPSPALATVLGVEHRLEQWREIALLTIGGIWLAIAGMGTWVLGHWSREMKQGLERITQIANQTAEARSPGPGAVSAILELKNAEHAALRANRATIDRVRRTDTGE